MTTFQNNWLPRLDPDAYPILLPHFLCRENKVYLGNRHVRTLPRNQSDFLAMCDGRSTLSQAARATKVEPSFISEVALWLLWWPHAVGGEQHPNGKTDRLVMCARPEACWQGMGGRILQEAGSTPTLVISCFSPSVPAHPTALFDTPGEINFAGRDEAAMAARLALVGHTMWNIPEYPARIPYEHKDEPDSGDIYELLLETMLAVVNQVRPLEIFVPAAMTNSADAKAILKAALSLMGEGYLQCDLHVYEDSPALLGQRQADEFLSLFEGSYLCPAEYYCGITGTNPKKTSLSEVFLSSTSNVEKYRWQRSTERNAWLSGISGHTAAERFWKIQFDGL